jgi:ribosomal protein S18 acetylase RimI-like enzyme
MSAAASLSPDTWLSTALGKPTFRLALADETAPELPSGPCFVFAKIPVASTPVVDMLIRRGFALVETAAQFERPIGRIDGAAAARFARPGDEAAVRAIARSGFGHSRFHRDPRIPREIAGRIKEDWAGNFFAGKRGSHMLVAELSGNVVGFLLLLVDSEDVVIDLIATRADHRRRGLAQSMIAAAEREFGARRRFRVGTQLTNAPSIRLYESVGFRFASASHTLHLHREGPS